MSKINWGLPGSQFYEVGLDRGVLYTDSSPGIPWNGLTSVDEAPSNVDVKSYYIDGFKYADVRSGGEYEGTLKAYTYPDEFLPFDGVSEVEEGLYVENQIVSRLFHLSYRTLVSQNQSSKPGHYKIHLLYNLTAKPSSKNYSTITDSTDPVEFSWTLSGIPVFVPNLKPSVHFIIDSQKVHPAALRDIEDILYGNYESDARIMLPMEVADLIVNTPRDMY